VNVANVDLREVRTALAGLYAKALENRDPVIKGTLTYTGLLLAATDSKTRNPNKNDIRWHFSKQLTTLLVYGDFSRLPQEAGKSPVLGETKKFKGVNFMPVVPKSALLMCNLSIRIERRERPGLLIHDGDIDNRLKTIFDALKMPQNDNEVVSPDGVLPNKCVCLLEDDSMIAALNLVTVASLESLPRNHVRLTIDVEVKAHDMVFYPD